MGGGKSISFTLIQQFQMNRYISHWFLKWLFWYILNLYGKLHLLVWKFLQTGHLKGPKKGLKNVDCANWENIPIFSKWIDRLCAPQYSKIYRFIWRRMCVITHSFLKSVRFWRGLFWPFKAVNILLGGICMPNLKIYT